MGNQPSSPGGTGAGAGGKSPTSSGSRSRRSSKQGSPAASPGASSPVLPRSPAVFNSGPPSTSTTTPPQTLPGSPNRIAANSSGSQSQLPSVGSAGVNGLAGQQVSQPQQRAQPPKETRRNIVSKLFGRDKDKDKSAITAPTAPSSNASSASLQVYTSASGARAGSNNIVASPSSSPSTTPQSATTPASSSPLKTLKAFGSPLSGRKLSAQEEAAAPAQQQSPTSAPPSPSRSNNKASPITQNNLAQGRPPSVFGDVSADVLTAIGAAFPPTPPDGSPGAASQPPGSPPRSPVKMTVTPPGNNEAPPEQLLSQLHQAIAAVNAVGEPDPMMDSVFLDMQADLVDISSTPRSSLSSSMGSRSIAPPPPTNPVKGGFNKLRHFASKLTLVPKAKSKQAKSSGQVTPPIPNAALFTSPPGTPGAPTLPMAQSGTIPSPANSIEVNRDDPHLQSQPTNRLAAFFSNPLKQLLKRKDAQQDYRSPTKDALDDLLLDLEAAQGDGDELMPPTPWWDHAYPESVKDLRLDDDRPRTLSETRRLSLPTALPILDTDFFTTLTAFLASLDSLPPHLKPRPRSIKSMRRWSTGSQLSLQSVSSNGSLRGVDGLGRNEFIGGSPGLVAEGLGIWRNDDESLVATGNLLEDLVLGPAEYSMEPEEEDVEVEESKPAYVDEADPLPEERQDDGSESNLEPQEPIPVVRKRVVQRVDSVDSLGTVGHISLGTSHFGQEEPELGEVDELEAIAEEEDESSSSLPRTPPTRKKSTNAELDRLFDSALDDMALVDDIKDWLKRATSERMKEMMVRAHGVRELVGV